MKPRSAIGVLITGGMIFAIACGGGEKYEKPATPVRVQEVSEIFPGGDAGASERYSANILPSMQVELSFRNGGYISGIHQVRGANGRLRYVQEGDRVPKGTVLARLRVDDYAARVKQAEAGVAEAQSALGANAAQLQEAQTAMQQAERDLNRATKLLESGSLTRPEFEAAKTRFDMAGAKIEAIQAQKKVVEAKISGAQALLSEARLAQSDTLLRAPNDCYVLKRLVEPGALAAPGRPVFVVAERSSLKAVFGVPDTSLSGIRPGTRLTLSTEAIPGIEFNGWISLISPAADPKSRVFEVEVTIPRAPAQLRIGMIATITLPSTRSSIPVTAVPINAIVRLKDKSEGFAVNVITDQGGKQISRQREVSLGEAFGNMIAVKSGVSIGERVVVSGAAMMVDGDQVRIIP